MIACLDLDAFFAACEELDHPEYADVPLVVGGDPHSRGIVATANYPARRFGIHSAMSAHEAFRRCPHAVFVRPRMDRYRELSERVWETIAEIVPEVEQVGIDEGYLDFSAARTPHDAELLACRVQQAVKRRTKLSASVGVGANKLVAKVAVDRNKPYGITIVPPGDERRFLAPLALRDLPGVGPRTAERLEKAGLTRLGELARLTPKEQHEILPGKVGELLVERARGIDDRPLVSERPVRKSISREETLGEDVSDRAELKEILDELAGQVARYLNDRGGSARTVSVKLRYPDFTTRTRSFTLPRGIAEERVIARIARQLLDEALDDRPGALRQVGVSVSNLLPWYQLELGV